MRKPGQFSQAGEDDWIAERFAGRFGRFLDLGAHDGQSNSNTRALALAGWGGLCVEASPRIFSALSARYDDTPAVRCLHAAITPDRTGKIALLECQDQMSTIMPEHADRWHAIAGTEFVPVEVPALSVASLLNLHGSDWSLISIDVEGISADVCLAFPWAEMPTEMVVVEHDDRFAELQERLGKVGFKTVGLNGTNLGLAR